MRNKKYITATFTVVFAVCFFGNGPWLVSSFNDHEWVSVNSILVAILTLTIFIASQAARVSIGPALWISVFAFVIAALDIGLEYFGSGIVPNPLKNINGKAHTNYSFIESVEESRSMIVNYVVALGLVGIIILIKKSKSA